MESRYKIILSNNNLYKEIELAPAVQQVRVGTGVECDVRLNKKLFLVRLNCFLQKIRMDGLFSVRITCILQLVMYANWRQNS